MSTRSISTRVPEEIADHLAAEARRRSMTESDLIREMLAGRYLGARPSATEPERYDGQRMDGYAQLIFESPRPAPWFCIRWITRWERTWSTKSSRPPSRPPGEHVVPGAQEQGDPVMTSAIRQAIHERALLASLELRLREALR